MDIRRPLAGAIRATNPVDEDAMQVTVNLLLNGLPPQVQVYDTAQVLRDAGWLLLEALEELQMSHLLDLDYEPGHAAMVLRRLRPPVAQELPVQQHVVAAAGHLLPVQTSRRSLRAFPQASDAGYPTKAALGAWAPGFYSYLRNRVDGAAVDRLKEIKRDPVGFTWPAGHVHGGPDDNEILDSLINGTDGVGAPAEMVLLIPTALLDQGSGEQVWKWICEGTDARSDTSAGMMLQWFLSPPALAPGSKHHLKQTLDQWRKHRAELEQVGLKQEEITCRVSLSKLVAKLPEVKAALSAVEAAARLGGAKPTVDNILQAVEDKAAAYASEEQQSKYMANLAAYGTVGEPSKQPCFFWKKPGGCRRGQKCRFAHEGP